MASGKKEKRRFAPGRERRRGLASTAKNTKQGGGGQPHNKKGVERGDRLAWVGQRKNKTPVSRPAENRVVGWRQQPKKKNKEKKTNTTKKNGARGPGGRWPTPKK
jgi:hypothetical protein